MKKLMIAAAIVCAAAFAQAASVSWLINTAADPTGEGEMGDNDATFTGYLFIQSMTDASGATAAFTKEMAMAAIEAGSLDFLGSRAVGEGAEVYYGLNQADIGDFAKGGEKDNVITAYAIIVNDDDKSKVFITDFADTAINAMGASNAIDFGNITATGDYDNWTKVGAVPEPTSGLLLLLGVAGLALRRRRA